jgi:signal transduction histidine kinase
MEDAIFLPLTTESQSPIPAVLVFANRTEHVYDAEHLTLLNNIAQLVTHSFGRTVRLAEHTRLAAIGEFASGIAHEIRSPLATVVMALDHLGNLELPPASAKRVALASQETDRISRLLEDMLLYAKPLKLAPRSLDLCEFLRQMGSAHEEIGMTRGQRLTVECLTRAEIFADPDRLTQLWDNLTRNASDAAPPGSRITWRMRQSAQRGFVEVSVHNEGEPIPADVLPRLTQPFFTTQGSGTGLGLAIVRRIVEAHGGDLAIDSEANKGTLVYVTLPQTNR